VGKVVVVTGASAGGGRASAVAFASRGHTVALLARGSTGLEAAATDSWRAAAPVKVGEGYLVQAWALGPDGSRTEQQSRFTTATVHRSRTLRVETIQPPDGATVGVAQPVVIAFDAPVSSRRLVQAGLRVTTTPHVAGAWYWIDDSHVHFRPQAFWPPGTRVRVDVNLSDRSLGNGTLGGRNRASSFTVGRNQVLRVDTHAHRMTVQRDGRTVKSFDASTGKPGWETRDGTEVMQARVIHKHWTNSAIGAKKHFSLYSKYAIRITDSGEFVHDAPWARGVLGEANTSHGCVALKPDAMKWIWDNSLLGDPVIVTGTPRHHQDRTNTYDDWNIAWQNWNRGNA
jgi:lipoprotein-anchoring transpeptidase ErfK/SrfK